MVLGFYAECTISGDGLTRGCGGPEDKAHPHRLRWCPQCKGLFEWPADCPFTRRECGICAHRPGVPMALAAVAKLMAHLCGYKTLRQPNIIGVSWSEYLAEFESSGVITAEQFLAGDLEALRQLWQHLARQIKAAA